MDLPRIIPSIFCIQLMLIFICQPSYGIHNNTYSSTHQINNISTSKRLDFNLDMAVKRMSKAITFQTISYSPGQLNESEIEKFIKYLQIAFPLVHSTSWIERHIINNLSLVYVIKALRNNTIHSPFSSFNNSNIFTSSESNEKMVDDKPWILQSHQDVVPISDHDKWMAPPFSGQVWYIPKDHRDKLLYDPDNSNDTNNKVFTTGDNLNTHYYIYGRGTMDAKHIILAIMESVELIISQGLRLDHKDLILSFGHDEETSGLYGASEVAKYLKERFQKEPNTKPFSFVLDEGFNVMVNVLPNKFKLAGIGVNEKYGMVIKMAVNTAPGHSSIPTKENSISILGRAVNLIQSHDFPSFFGAPGTPDLEMVKRISHLFPNLHMMTNPEFYISELSKILVKNRYGNTLSRTSTAVTLIKGGTKINVNPTWAEAWVNHRVHPLQTPEQVHDIDVAVVNDPRVNITIDGYTAINPFSSYTVPEFMYLENTIHQIFPDSIVVPAILPASTDSKHLINIVQQIYRFSPLLVTLKDVERVHGIDERISVYSYENCINFYYRLIQNVSGFMHIP